MNKLILLITAVAVIAAGIFFTLNKEAPPNISYQTIDGKTITTNDLKGQVVLVKFWATTCFICIRQMPDTADYFEKYKHQGYNTIAVAVQYDDLDAIKHFAKEHPLPFPIAYDASGEIAKQFGGIRFTPVGFLLDREGNIVKRYIGAYDKKEFIQTLEKTLAQH